MCTLRISVCCVFVRVGPCLALQTQWLSWERLKCPKRSSWSTSLPWEKALTGWVAFPSFLNPLHTRKVIVVYILNNVSKRTHMLKSNTVLMHLFVGMWYFLLASHSAWRLLPGALTLFCSVLGSEVIDIACLSTTATPSPMRWPSSWQAGPSPPTSPTFRLKSSPRECETQSVSCPW